MPIDGISLFLTIIVCTFVKCWRCVRNCNRNKNESQLYYQSGKYWDEYDTNTEDNSHPLELV